MKVLYALTIALFFAACTSEISIDGVYKSDGQGDFILKDGKVKMGPHADFVKYKINRGEIEFLSKSGIPIRAKVDGERIIIENSLIWVKVKQ